MRGESFQLSEVCPIIGTGMDTEQTVSSYVPILGPFHDSGTLSQYWDVVPISGHGTVGRRVVV